MELLQEFLKSTVWIAKNKKELLKILSYPHNSQNIHPVLFYKNHLSTISRWISGKVNVRSRLFPAFFALFRHKTTGYPQKKGVRKQSTMAYVENLSTISTIFSDKNCNFTENFTILWKDSNFFPQFRKNRCGKYDARHWFASYAYSSNFGGVARRCFRLWGLTDSDTTEVT